MALKITREQLDEYRELLERKKSIETEKRAIEEQIKQFETNVQSQMASTKQQTTKRFDWVFTLERGNLNVSWKKVVIQTLGSQKAIDLVNAGKNKGKVKLVVTPPQDLAHLFAKAESDE